MRLNVFFPDIWRLEEVEVGAAAYRQDLAEIFRINEDSILEIFMLPAGAIKLVEGPNEQPKLLDWIHERLQPLTQKVLTRTHSLTVTEVFSKHSEDDLHLVVRTLNNWVINIYRVDTDEVYPVVVELHGNPPAAAHQVTTRRFLPDGIGSKQAKFYLPPYGTSTYDPVPTPDNIGLESLQSAPCTALEWSTCKRGFRPNTLHLVLNVTASSTLKRKLSDTSIQDIPQISKRIRESALGNMTSSELSKPNAYKQLQDDEENMILDDRSTPDRVPALSLLYPGFGRFINRSEGLENMAIEEGFKAKVDSFAQFLVKLSFAEMDRTIFNLLVQDYLVLIIYPFAAPASILDSYKGHILGPHGLPSFILRWADNNDLAYAEAAAHLSQCARALTTKDPYSLPSRWKIPCIVMTVVDVQVTFYALVLLGSHHRIASITPSLSCVQDACDGNERQRLYRAFSACTQLIKEIIEDAALIEKATLPPIPPNCCRTPGIVKLPTFKKPEEWLYFQIVAILYDDQPDRQIYVAQTSDNVPILVKFTQRYSIEVHELCAEQGMAPEILAYEELPRGWIAIAMRFLTNIAFINNSPHREPNSAKWKEQLRSLRLSLESRNLVHGDLRAVNILVSGEDPGRAIVIDFDWGGKAGEVRYPSGCEMNRDLWRERTHMYDGDPCGMPITTEDDRRILEKTLAQLPE